MLRALTAVSRSVQPATRAARRIGGVSYCKWGQIKSVWWSRPYAPPASSRITLQEMEGLETAMAFASQAPMAVRRPSLVVLTGKAGHGKDTAAAHLIRRHSFVKLSFAGPLKRAATELFCIQPEVMEDAALKEAVDPRWGTTPRRILQEIGSALRASIDDQFLVKRLLMELVPLLRNGERVVVTDCRFDIEAQALVETMDELGIRRNVWRIDASERLGGGSTLKGAAAAHESERGISDRFVTHTVHNNSTPADLVDMIDCCVARELSE